MNNRTYTYEVYRIGAANRELKTVAAHNAVMAFYFLAEWSMLENVPIYSAVLVSIE